MRALPLLITALILAAPAAADPNWVGRDVVDERNQKIGEVSEVTADGRVIVDPEDSDRLLTLEASRLKPMGAGDDDLVLAGTTKRQLLDRAPYSADGTRAGQTGNVIKPPQPRD
ncbi:MAG TPA: hypothetical protein VED40_07070 [Azospirillaceae bacterium]|nr:hypothetical protein [Azospirillaceae bacterium]